MTELTVRYFASLRDAAGIESEIVGTQASGLRELYEELRARHGFVWTPAHLRVAVDGDFAGWDDVPRAGSDVAFIPPVSGG